MLFHRIASKSSFFSYYTLNEKLVIFIKFSRGKCGAKKKIKGKDLTYEFAWWGICHHRSPGQKLFKEKFHNPNLWGILKMLSPSLHESLWKV